MPTTGEPLTTFILRFSVLLAQVNSVAIQQDLPVISDRKIFHRLCQLLTGPALDILETMAHSSPHGFASFETVSTRLLTAARFSEQAGRSLLLSPNSRASSSVPHFGLAAVPSSSLSSSSARVFDSLSPTDASLAPSRAGGRGIGGRGRGDRSSGRGFIGPCHTCGEIGHFRRECPQHPCERCQEHGQPASRCPAPAPKLAASRPISSRALPGPYSFSALPAPPSGAPAAPPAGGTPPSARGPPLRGLVAAASDSDSKFTFDEWINLINKESHPYIFSLTPTVPTVTLPLSPAPGPTSTPAFFRHLYLPRRNWPFTRHFRHARLPT